MILETSAFPLFWFSNIAAITISQNLIIVRPGCKTQELLAHESVHQQQMAILGTFGTPRFWLSYWFSKEFRKNAEVEAYKVSIQHGVPIEVCAGYLVDLYSLDVTREQAIKLLRS
jgi:hypothetical protein